MNYIQTLLPLESLHKAPGPFLRCHVEWDARKLAIDVQSALQLEEVPVLHDHLGFCPRHTMLDDKKKKTKTCCLNTKLNNLSVAK